MRRALGILAALLSLNAAAQDAATSLGGPNTLPVLRGIGGASPVPPPGVTYLYLDSMGQSGTIGEHGNPALTISPPYAACALMLNDAYGVRGSQGVAVTGGITGFIGAFETTSGIFGETHITPMMADLCAYPTNGPYIGRSDGQGGTLLTQINKGTQPYANALFELTAANTAALAAGNHVDMPAVMFIHGGSDDAAGTPPATYETELLALAADVQTDFKAVTGQSDAILFYIAQTNTTGKNGNTIAQAQYATALIGGSGPPSPLFIMSNPVYMFPANQVGHLANVGYAWAGEYLARAYKQTSIDGVPFEPLHPTAVAFNGGDRSKIEVTFHVPTGVLVNDTTILQGQAFKKGFEYSDDCGLVYVTGATITGANTMEIQLSAAASCTTPVLAFAFNPPAMLRNVTVPTIAAAGSGYTNGPCTLTLNFDPTLADAQATVSATISGGVVSAITAVTYQGLYPRSDNGNHSGMATTSSCGGSGATLTGKFQETFESDNKYPAWGTIRDQDATISRLSNHLYNWLLSFQLPVTG